MFSFLYKLTICASSNWFDMRNLGSLNNWTSLLYGGDQASFLTECLNPTRVLNSSSNNVANRFAGGSLNKPRSKFRDSSSRSSCNLIRRFLLLRLNNIFFRDSKSQTIISILQHQKQNCRQNKVSDVSVLPTGKLMTCINQSDRALYLRYAIIINDDSVIVYSGRQAKLKTTKHH